MQTATFDSKKQNLMELVMSINTERVLDKVLGYVREKLNETNSTKYDIAEEEHVMLNEDTIDAIRETRSGKYAGTLDMTDFNSFLESIDNV